jgi:hypothetical protein
MLLLSVVACAAVNSAALAAPEPCKDCDPATGLTIREQIRAERARDADRVAKESASRPWDGKDIGQAKPTNSPPVVR